MKLHQKFKRKSTITALMAGVLLLAMIAIISVVGLTEPIVKAACPSGCNCTAAGTFCSGSGNTSFSGKCAKDKPDVANGRWWDTCNGASWVEYSASSDDIVIDSGDHITGCKTAGGWYYRLGLQDFTASSGKNTGWLTGQHGLKPVSSVSPGGGSIAFVHSPSAGTTDWSAVEAKFSAAQNAGLVPASKSWSSTSWFCWDPKLDEPTGVFSSGTDASVTYSGGTESSNSPEDGTAGKINVTLPGDEEKAKVIFSHKILYRPEGFTDSIPESDVDNAITRWTVTQTINRTPEAATGAAPSTETKTLKQDVSLEYNGKTRKANWGETHVDSGEETQWITIAQGEKVEICQKIEYHAKNMTFVGGSDGRYTRKNDGNGSGSSSACVEITRDNNVGEGEGKFKAFSKVIPEGGVNEGEINYADSSDPSNRKATVKRTTANSEYTAEFFQRVIYNTGLTEVPDGATFDDNTKTHWTITTSEGLSEIISYSGEDPHPPKDGWLEIKSPKSPKDNDPVGTDIIGRTTVTFNVPDAGVTVCRTIEIEPVTIHFDISGSDYQAKSENDKSDATACIEVSKSANDQGEFLSRTTATVMDTGDTITAEDRRTEQLGPVTVTSSPITVQFQHQMRYEGDTIDNAYTPYHLSQSGDVGANGYFSPGNFYSNQPPTIVPNTQSSVLVDINEGETKKVCQRIDYDRKYVKRSTTGGVSTPLYEPLESGFSEVCVDIERTLIQSGDFELEKIWTYSRVDVDDTPVDIPSGYNAEAESNLDPNVYDDIEFSTDNNRVDGVFKHEIRTDRSFLPKDITPPGSSLSNYNPNRNYYAGGKLEIKYTIEVKNSSTPGNTECRDVPLTLATDAAAQTNNPVNCRASDFLDLSYDRPEEMSQKLSIDGDTISLHYEVEHKRKEPYVKITANWSNGVCLYSEDEQCWVHDYFYKYSFNELKGTPRSSEVLVGAIRPDSYGSDRTTFYSIPEYMFIGEMVRESYAASATARTYAARRAVKSHTSVEDVKVAMDKNTAINGPGYLIGTAPRDHTNTDAPRDYYWNKMSSDSLVRWANTVHDDNIVTGPDENSMDGNDITVDSDAFSLDAPDYTGDKICVAMGIKFKYYFSKRQVAGGPRTWQEATGFPKTEYWMIYDNGCSFTAKKPSISVINGNLFAKDAITGVFASRHSSAAANTGLVSPSTSFDRVYGSWGEHLISASASDIYNPDKGLIKQFTSGSAQYAGKFEFTANGNPLMNKLSSLTISNADTANYGKSGIASVLDDTVFISRLEEYLYPLRKTDSPVETIGNDIYISGNIIHEEKVKSINLIPQTIIYAKTGKIYIDKDVTRLDAWIIAPHGEIYTCAKDHTLDTAFKPSAPDGTETTGGASDAPAYNNTNNICDKPLTINGPVLAQGISLDRSFGADNVSYNPTSLSDKDTPAELFNLPTDSYLWAYAQAGRYKSSYTEAYSRELPPRY